MPIQTFFKYFLALSLFLPNAWATDNCKENFKKQLALFETSIVTPNNNMLKEAAKESGYFYYGRLRQAFEALSEADYKKLFDPKFGGLSPLEFEELYWAIKSGMVKASREQENLIDDLNMFIIDSGRPIFWDETGGSAYFNVLQRLRKYDESNGYAGNNDITALFTDHALAQTERELLARALGEQVRGQSYANSRWYDRLVRFFLPHYNPVKSILSLNNTFRKRLQLMYKMDEPAYDALDKYTTSLNLSADKLARLKGLVTDTTSQLSEVRKQVNNLYGFEISLKTPLKEQDIRIRLLKNRAKEINGESEFNAIQNQAGDDMDIIDDVIANARVENNLPRFRPMEEYHGVHLQIRNPQYRRETGTLYSHYLALTGKNPLNSNYNVEIEWTVTVLHMKTTIVTRTETDANGNTRTVSEPKTETWTTSYTKTRQDVLKAKYEEVLRGEINPDINEVPELPTALPVGAHAVSASNGAPYFIWMDENKMNSIIEAGSKARENEKEFRGLVNQIINQVDSITNEGYQKLLTNDSAVLKILADLKEAERILTETLIDLEKYVDIPESRIKSFWQYDIPSDFKDRNNQMVRRYKHLIKRIQHLHEQVRRRQSSLEIEYSLPEYSEQLATLKKIHDRYRTIQLVGGITLGVGIGAGTYLYMENKEEVDTYVNDLFHRLFGADKLKIQGP